ncbi:MAG: finger-like region [Proteobacteria bacterium]|nr:finger-like region [Pseudomonadota bacterium]
MRTRCPACNTVFRVTSEQLRLKAGKVRCGHCQTLFNAFDQLVTETPVAERPLTTEAPPSPLATSVPAPVVLPEPPVVSIDAEFLPEPEPEPEPEAIPEPEPESEPVETMELPPVARLPDGEELPETAEESAQAAREVGLVAVRELTETAGYNRWAAGTLATGGADGFDSASGQRAVWPFVLFLLVLLLLLIGQLLYHFRTDLVRRLPEAAALYALAEIAVPLPRQVELVAIETSDLQSDNQRGMFVLQATLRNRASYAQAWPALELTLTDTHDSVVSRRVLAPADYLPPTAPPAAFPANGETAVRLWVEAKDIGAAGYRLYVFYP